jgi:hypothetical protein
VLIVALPLAFFPQSRDAYLNVKVLLLAGGRLLRRGSATSSRPFPNDSVTCPPRSPA